MGTIITVAGADFSANAIGYNAPNTRGLTGLFLMGGTLTQSERNLVSGGINASQIGTVTVGAGYIEGSLGNCLKSGLADTSSFTAIVAGRVPVLPATTANSCCLAGSYTFVGSFSGWMLDMDYTKNFRFQGGFTPAAGGAAARIQATVAYAAAATWYMAAVVVDGTANTATVYNLTTGATGTAVATGGALAPSASTRYIGSFPGADANDYAAAGDVALYEEHNVALTLAELQAIYTAFKPVLSNRGIVV